MPVPETATLVFGKPLMVPPVTEISEYVPAGNEVVAVIKASDVMIGK